MIYVYFNHGSKSLGGFELPAVPRNGEIIRLWFYREIAHQREKYTEEALKNFDMYEGTSWEVMAVTYDATYNREGLVRCLVVPV